MISHLLLDGISYAGSPRCRERSAACSAKACLPLGFTISKSVCPVHLELLLVITAVFYSLFCFSIYNFGRERVISFGVLSLDTLHYDPVLFSFTHFFFIFSYTYVEVWKDMHHSFKRGWQN